MRPARPWGSSPGGHHLKTEQGKQESACTASGGVGGPGRAGKAQAQRYPRGRGRRLSQPGRDRRLRRKGGGGKGTQTEAGHKLLEEKQLVLTGLTAVTWKRHLA